MTDAKKHIFISYSRQGGMALARRVSAALSGMGFDADVPIQPIWEPDAEWDDEVVADIRTAAGVVFIEPKDERAAPHLMFEIGAAHALGKKIVGVGANREEFYLEEAGSDGVLHIYDLIDATNLSDEELAVAIVAGLGLTS
ncbi:MAG TPA: hypothetical protein PLQ11_05825 [Beijerinckiaceae bacterium]|nr:hypothetical protein [Beijerinckiaceae bacterium]